ncbi:Oidioi.mRNA.OKI2018_I69.chr2.g6543.t1.cds [Oikopleura dioica]|uniref:Oidioi.mRNA.OKI2018_I69.chr2.g6543.t1.cds n=1 Tax=Oikopleura dioica TaxID=34765 RepID=A0ABN7T404_OIKDI|nr:Oidioi.mRNA.OKI2018_I69.chr2.g6543.t1.cds [Oikopleura dioica]
MKISAFCGIFSASASELSVVTPPPSCPDLDKFEICTANCTTALDSCKDACNPVDYSCPGRCDATALECNSSCPCGNDCPNGCQGCANAVCSAEEYVLIINHYHLYENEAILFNLGTEQFSRASINGFIEYNYDIEDACYSFMKGEHYFLGGYENPRAIAKFNIDTCEVKPGTGWDDILEIGHMDGVYGSCANYNDVTYLCFYEDGIDAFGCTVFDGENQKLIDAKSQHPHDWADMTVYDDKMWVVGGCDPRIQGF